MSLSPNRTRWSVEQSLTWARGRPLLVGANYLPRNAINQLELWQAETWSPQVIDEELGWAESLGFNSMRVFLHDLMWQRDPSAFLDRIDGFLAIAARHGIGAMFVLFDSCWFPFPYPGKQRDPEPGVHNSFWLQSPGVAVLRDPARFDALEGYVAGVVGRFRDDARVQVWDIWNEPDNANKASRGSRDLGESKSAIVQPLLEKAFAWARDAEPAQPLTSGVWHGDWSSEEKLEPMARTQVENSDVISFHSYAPPDQLARCIESLGRYQRPLLCTEYMARPIGSTLESCLPLLREHGIGAYNWGFVAGKSQTYYPWDSWQTPYPPEPAVWFHDILRGDGTPYRESEATFLRSTL